MSSNATADLELSVDSYATYSQIQALIPWRTLSDTTTPTRYQATEITRDIFARINGMLDVQGYVIAIASGNTTSIRILGRLNALGAAAEIEGATYSAGNEARSERGVELYERYMTLMESFEKGKISLPNATRKTNYIHRKDEQKASYGFNQVSGTEQSPTFTVRTKF